MTESKFNHPIVEALCIYFEEDTYDAHDLYGLASLIEKIPCKEGGQAAKQVTAIHRMFIYMLPDAKQQVDAIEGVQAALWVLDYLLEKEAVNN